MSLSEVSIRRPVFAWMLMAALIFFGAISFQRLGISSMPDVDFPVVSVSLRLDGAAPEQMELTVVDVIEDAVMGIEGLSSVTSNVSQGIANITCNFVLGHDVNVAVQEVQTRITQISNRLPQALYPPVITKTNPEDQPILWVMVTADEKIPLSELMIYARNTLKDQFSTLTGVGNVMLAGYVEPNLRVWIDTKKLKSFDLTSTDVWSAIQAEQVEQPAGRIESLKDEKNIRVLGEARSPEEFAKIRINTRGGGANYNPIPLSKVARVEEGVADLRALSRMNGKTAVGLGIVKQHGANAVEVGKLVREKVKSIGQFLLPGYHVDVQLDTTKFVQESVWELNMLLLFSALLTSIVCYLFLGSWSSTINVLMAIPTSIVGAFSAIYFFGFTLNTFTLLALSLAIGIVVDDAIMMLENIVRHFEMGKSKRQAALDGSKEITFAAIATTLAIAAIFIPVVFMQGVVGRFFYQYGITVTVAVFLSLLEALTLTPMRCASFMHSAKHGQSGWLLRTMDRWMETLSGLYQRSLQWCLVRRWKVVMASALLFVSSMGLLIHLRKELIPPQDQSLFLVSIKTPVGSSIEATDAVFAKAEEYLHALPEVQDTYVTVGNYQSNNIVNAGVIYVILKDIRHRRRSQSEVMEKARAELRSRLSGNDVFTQDLSITGLSSSRGFPVEFSLEGSNWPRVREHSLKFIERLRGEKFLEDVNTDFQDGMPLIEVVPDRDQAALRGVSLTNVAQEMNYLVGGQIFGANTQYPKDGHRYYIRIRSEPSQHREPEDLNQIYLRNNRGTNGEMVRLTDTAKIREARGSGLISRVNRMRAVPVFANVAEGVSQQAALERVESLAQELLPKDVHLRATGSAKSFREAFESLIFALILGVIVAYMVLASQFNSFIHPVTVLMALPFSLTGALIALAVTGQSLSLFSMIGLILLMGIVKKNSILLVDFTNQKRESGMKPEAALLSACPIRLRPILMTSFATVVGAIPEAINFGSGAETRVPMAIAIIGGVLLSTLLTLYVVPCVYLLFVRFERPESEEALRDLKTQDLSALKGPM